MISRIKISEMNKTFDQKGDQDFPDDASDQTIKIIQPEEVVLDIDGKGP